MLAPEPGQSFHVMSNFENEAQAIAYAKELQSYYDSQNLDVKVQIDTNLAEMDDTGEFAATAKLQSTNPVEGLDARLRTPQHLAKPQLRPNSNPA